MDTKIYVTSSVRALFYPKQCMKPGFMCLLFIIYFVHGLEIPSENFLYHSLQSLANGYPESRCAAGISALGYILAWG